MPKVYNLSLKFFLSLLLIFILSGIILVGNNSRIFAAPTPEIILTSNLNPSLLNQDVTFTVLLSGKVGVPQGNISFYDGTTLVYSTSSNLNRAIYKTKSLTAGSHLITALYGGSLQYNSVKSSGINQVVSSANLPTVNITSNPNPSIYSNGVTFSVNVKGNLGIPTGEIDFLDNGDTFSIQNIDSNGNATFVYNNLSMGDHVIVADYMGDNNYTEQTSNTINQKVEFLTTINSSSNPSSLNSPVTFNINVGEPSNKFKPLGKVDILDNTTVIKNISLDGSGNGSFTITSLSPGNHKITANYLGDINSGPSSSLVLNQFVTNSIITSTTIPINGTVISGQTVQLKFNVSDFLNIGIPSGNVNVEENSIIIGMSTLDGDGNGSFSTNSLIVGTHNITLSYLGDSNFQPTFYTLVLTVNSSADTTSNLISTHNPSRVGVPINFNVNVLPNGYPAYSEGFVPIGNVILVDGLNTLDTKPLNSAGYANFTANSLSSGTHNIKAFFQGSLSFNPSTSNTIIQVVEQGQNSIVTINSEKNPALITDIIPLDIQVKGLYGTATGIITLKDGLNTIQTLNLDNNGKTTINLNSLTYGSHIISAIYSGDGVYNANSTSLNQIISDTTNFLISIARKDANTSLSQTSLGSTIHWIIQYSNNGKPITGAKIYFPIKDSQSYIIGSIILPGGWNTTYSKNINCDDNTFNYISNINIGNDDINIKCIRFLINPTIINSPSNSSNLSTLSINTVSINSQINNFGVGDVLKVSGYKSKIFSLLHHSFSGSPQNSPLLSCFDFNKNNGSGVKGDICASVNSKVSYPIKLGIDGVSNINDQLGVNASSIAASIPIGNKLYFSYSDILGGGIMCWDMDIDDYCTGNGLNNKGQIRLDFRPWTDSVGLDPITHNGLPQGTMFDIEYNSNKNELYSITQDGRIVCYNITLGSRCSGQSDSPFSGYSIGLESIPLNVNSGLVVYINNKVYGTVGGANSAQYIGCFDLNTKNRCTNWETPKQILNGGIYRTSVIFPVNNQLCETHNNSIINQSTINCYDEANNLFKQQFIIVDKTINNGSWYLKGQNTPGRIYILGWGNSNVYCYLTDQDISTGIACPGWESGKPVLTNPPGNDFSLYSVTQSLGCLFVASNTGNIYVMDPTTGGKCTPQIITTSGTSNTTLDAKTLYCNTTDNIYWDKLVYNDTGVIPSPTYINANIYDLNNCSNLNNSLNCSGTPLKNSNLLLTSDHSLDLSDIVYAEHKQLAAIVNYAYSSIPTPLPNFYIRLKNNNQPSICIDSLLKPDPLLCTNILTKTCANPNIVLSNNTNTNTNPLACLDVLAYGGKSSTSIGNQTTLICANTSFYIAQSFNVDLMQNLGQPLSYPDKPITKKNDNTNVTQIFQNIVNNLSQNIPLKLNTNSLPVLPLVLNGLLLAIIAILTLPLRIFSISGSSLNLFQIIGLLAGLLIKRNQKYWGIIFDEESNIPVPFAIVNLLKLNPDKSIILLKSTISDLNGRYRIELEKQGKYQLEIKASGYKSLIKDINNIYFFNNKEILADLPLLKESAKFNLLKKLSFYRKENLISILNLLSISLSIIGIITTILSLLKKFNIFTLLLLIIYIIIISFAINPFIRRMRSKTGKVSELNTNVPIASAAVRIFNKNRQLQITLSNKEGIVRFNLAKGDYNVLATKRGYLMNTLIDFKDNLGLENRFLAKDGYLDKDIKMEKINNFNNSNTLDSPFS